MVKSKKSKSKASEKHKQLPSKHFPAKTRKKALATSKSLRTVQTDQNLAVKTFSKFNHNHTVDAVLEIVSRTLFRSYGVLFGATLSIICLLILIFINQQYGYGLVFQAIVIAYVVGYLLGLLIELFKFSISK